MTMNLDYNPAGSGDLDAIKSDGTATPRDSSTQKITFGTGTFYVELGSDQALGVSMGSLQAVHLAWNAAFAATITVEGANFPRGNERLGTGLADVSSIDTTAGNWIPLSSSTNVDVTGTGNTSTGLTVTAGGSNAGGCMYILGNDGPRRLRIKLVVGTGGVCRINRRSKNAA